MGKTSCVVVVAISVVIMFAGQVFSSEDEDGGDAGCPPLNPGSGSVRLVCEEGGQPANCKSPRVGTVARSVWKKDVIKQGKGVTSVVCKPDGTWKKSGGSGSSPSRGGGGAGSGVGYERYEELGSFKWVTVALPTDMAESVCKSDGAHLMVLDSIEKMQMVENLKRNRSPVFEFTSFQDDLLGGITNRDNKAVFVTMDGKSTENIPKFREKGGKLIPDACVTYNMVVKQFFMITCAESRGFICEMPK